MRRDLVFDLILQLIIVIIAVCLASCYGYYVYNKQKQKIRKLLTAEISILDDTIKSLLEDIETLKSDCCENNIQIKLLGLTGQMLHIMLKVYFQQVKFFFYFLEK